MQFTRRGDDFVVKYHVICEKHFEQSCFIRKKKQLRLQEGTAPTIFERLTKHGKEKVVVKFDTDLVAYIDNENLLDPVYDKDEHGKNLVKEQTERMKEVKSFCRFCLEDKGKDENLIAISKLEDYYIKLDEVYTIIGLDRKFDGIFGNEMCEECFQQVITFDGYRKRCHKSQTAIIIDLNELEQKVREVTGNFTKYSAQFAEEIPLNSSVAKIEESFESNDDQRSQDESTDFNNGMSSLVKTENVMVKTDDGFHSVKIKEEAKEEPMYEDEYNSFDFPAVDMNDYDSEDDQPLVTPVKAKPAAELTVQPIENEEAKPNISQELSDDDFNWKEDDELPEKAAAVKIDVMRGSKKNDFSLLVDDEKVAKEMKQYYANRIYECWYCRLVSSLRYS